jgi:hypothetical protein
MIFEQDLLNLLLTPLAGYLFADFFTSWRSADFLSSTGIMSRPPAKRNKSKPSKAAPAGIPPDQAVKIFT